MDKIEENLNCYGYIKFSNSIAFMLGSTEAYILAILDHWINFHKEKEKTSKNKMHYLDGRWATYITIADLKSQILVVSERSIKSAIKHLRDLGIIIVSHHSKGAYKNTNWYSIDYTRLYKLMNDENKNDSAKIAPYDSAKSAPCDSAKIAPYTIDNYTINNIQKNTNNSCSFQNQEHGGSKEEFFDYLVSGLNVNEIFANTVLYFIDSYSANGYGLHSNISEKKFMELCDEFYNAIERNNICDEDWSAMIDDYFKQKFRGKCDHSIFHFFTPGVLDNLYHHVSAKTI